MIRALLFVVLFAAGSSTKLPGAFKTCNRLQADFVQCTCRAAEINLKLMDHPMKDLRLPGLKPLLIPSLVIGSGQRTVAVDQHFSHCEMWGLDEAQFQRFEFDFQERVVHIDVTFPEVRKNCNYELNGKVLLLPIKGKGDSVVVLKNMRIWGRMSFQEKKRSDRTYIKIVSQQLSLDADHASFQFDNLFDGEKELGRNINNVLNNNWKDVFEDVKDGYARAISDMLQAICNNFWQKVSLEEAFDN